MVLHYQVSSFHPCWIYFGGLVLDGKDLKLRNAFCKSLRGGASALSVSYFLMSSRKQLALFSRHLLTFGAAPATCLFPSISGNLTSFMTDSCSASPSSMENSSSDCSASGLAPSPTSPGRLGSLGCCEVLGVHRLECESPI